MQLCSSNLHFPDVTKTPLAIESSLALTGDEKGPREGRTKRAMERMDGEAESVSGEPMGRGLADLTYT